MLVFLSGIIASMAHVVTGPDHLAAVTPLAISSKKKSWAIGLSWGLGHVTGMLMIGAVFLLFRDLLPVEAISSHSEVIIGILLVIIGLWAILRLYLNSHFGHVLVGNVILLFNYSLQNRHQTGAVPAPFAD